MVSSGFKVRLPVTDFFTGSMFENGEVEIGSNSREIESTKNLNVDSNKINYITEIQSLIDTLSNYTDESERLLKSLTKGRITREKLKSLFKKGKGLEKDGNYKEALQIYRNILIFNLSPLDRDVVLSKIGEINRKIVIDRIIRKENRSASVIKTNADEFKKSGNMENAIKLYIKIIKEYPNSNYVDGAIQALLEYEGYSKK